MAFERTKTVLIKKENKQRFDTSCSILGGFRNAIYGICDHYFLLMNYFFISVVSFNKLQGFSDRKAGRQSQIVRLEYLSAANQDTLTFSAGCSCLFMYMLLLSYSVGFFFFGWFVPFLTKEH